MKPYFIRVIYNSCRRSMIKTINATSKEEAIAKFERRYYSRLHRYKSYYVEDFRVEEPLLS